MQPSQPADFGCYGRVQNGVRGRKEGGSERKRRDLTHLTQSIVKLSCTSFPGRNGSVLSIISITLVQEYILVGGTAEVMERMSFGLPTSVTK